MIRTKNLNLIKKILKIFSPVVLVGCICAYFAAEIVLLILGGNEYLNAVPIFRLLIPVLFFGFFATVLGWPTLGAIQKSKQVTISTVTGAVTNIVLLICLILTNSFTLINVAIVRVITEIVFLAMRSYFFGKYRYLFKQYYEE